MDDLWGLLALSLYYIGLIFIVAVISYYDK